MTNAAVLPVPFFARARMSRFSSAIGIASSWMGEGLSNPASKMPMRSSLRRRISSNSVPFVAVTSSVCGRMSFGGGLSPAFQDASGVDLLLFKTRRQFPTFQVATIRRT